MDENEDKNKKERYKRVPVYTKEHYGNSKPQRTKRAIDPLPPLILVVMIIGVIYTTTRPKQAWEIEKENNEWYKSGAYDLCEEHLKEQLRDPKSYERAGDIKVIQDNGIEKRIAWEFRARNGFGGMNATDGVCLIIKNKKSVAASIK